jgi:hypothetical protein
MSNVTVFNPGQVPAFARQGQLSSVAKALAGGGAQTGKRVSIKGGVFRLISDGKEVAAIDERFLDVIIVNAAPKVNRTYYEGTYDEANPAPPACWSADGDRPDAAVKNPQSPNCANCPQNVKGSGQGDTRACRFSQRVAVVLANDPSGDVLQLSLPATSIFGKAEGENMPLQEFARRLAAQGVDPTMVVTRLKFDTKAPVPKLFFKPMRWLEEAEYAVTSEKGRSEDAIKAVTFTVAQTDGVQVPEPAPLAGKPLKAATKAPAQAAPQTAEDDEPPAPPPAVRKPAAEPQNAVPPAQNLAATLASWDD